MNIKAMNSNDVQHPLTWRETYARPCVSVDLKNNKRVVGAGAGADGGAGGGDPRRWSVNALRHTLSHNSETASNTALPAIMFSRGIRPAAAKAWPLTSRWAVAGAIIACVGEQGAGEE